MPSARIKIRIEMHLKNLPSAGTIIFKSENVRTSCLRQEKWIRIEMHLKNLPLAGTRNLKSGYV